MPKSRVAIVGLGLIGGSMGLAIKKSKLDAEIIGHDKDPGIMSRAQKRGAVDATKWNLIDACDGAGLVILALPIDGIKDTLAALKPHLAPGVIVTDTATTKVPVLDWAKDLPEGVHFIGGDPVIQPGRRGPTTGIEAANSDLFKDATYCLVPSTTTGAPAIDTVASFATMLGAKPFFIDAAEHDGLMTGVEHLPAALATALLAVTVRSQGWREMSKLAGENFRAAIAQVPQDGATAREQFLAHRVDLVRWIDDVTAELGALRGMLAREDSSALETLVQSLAEERDKWMSGKLETADSSVDAQPVQFNPAHLLIGGLADRTPRKKR
jgi:prephenate dehydrogenase